MMKVTSKGLVDTVNIKPVSLPDWVKPVGIAGPVNVGGEVETKTQGSGTGIFATVFDIANTLYSTYKGATTTAQPGVVNQVGQTTSTFSEETKAEKLSIDEPAKLLLYVAGAWLLLKFLGIKI